MDSDTFEQTLLEVLRHHPAGLSEYELIQALDDFGQPGFDTATLRENLSLFQTHFFLFHSLYRLRDRLWENREARLDINALCIQLLPVVDKAGAEISEHDPLREYYLDLDNLEKTDSDDVARLLTHFWAGFISNDERRDALSELDLQDPVDWSTIKDQHRRLVMEHHPDRGGDEERLRAINAAMDVLARDARHSRKKSN
ncbi:DNA-J related domain-containing protein [Kaarinaea lacus]